jgi:hypothetical protein
MSPAPAPSCAVGRGTLIERSSPKPYLSSEISLCVQIKPKHLNDAVFDAPSSSSTHTLGQVKRKHETYDLWSLGDRGDNDVDRDQIGGDEMKGLSCLLPRKSKDGKLYLGKFFFYPQTLVI